MLEIINQNKDDVDLSDIRGGGGGGPESGVCADCGLCGDCGNDNSYPADIAS